LLLSQRDSNYKTKKPILLTLNSTPKINWNLFLILPIYILAFNQFALITADTDLWGHIKFGEHLWAQKSFPTTNIYSYTAPEYQWINHEWLAELIFYAIYSIFDSTGLLIFKGFIGLLLIHLICTYNLTNNARPWILAVSLILTIPTLAQGFMVRPHLWTLLFFTLLIILLTKGLEGKRACLYWIPFLMMFWVNCHGGVVAGMGILSVVTLTEGTRSLISGEKLWKPLLVIFICSCLAILINPAGIELWQFFFHSLSQPRNITEWDPIPLWGKQFLFLKLMVLLFFITLLLPGKKTLWRILIILGSIYFGFKHQRHSMLTAIVLAIYLPIYLSRGLESWGKNITNAINAGSLNSLTKLFLSLFMVLQLLDGFSKYNQNELKILVEPQVYPSYLAQYMRENELGGNILVPFDWGEYFIWKLPTSKVSIDGRFRTAYPEKIIDWNKKVYSVKNPDSKLLEKYPTDLIVVRKKDTPKNYLRENNDWTKIYEDIIAVLFVSKNQTSVLKKFKTNELIQPTEPPSLNFP
jgi:hypothetical protein